MAEVVVARTVTATQNEVGDENVTTTADTADTEGPGKESVGLNHSIITDNDLKNSDYDLSKIDQTDSRGWAHKISNGSSTVSSPANSRAVSPNVVERKYVRLVDRIHKREKSGAPFLSLEFFPPRTESGVANLIARLERLAVCCPLFCDMTWHQTDDPANTQVLTSSISMADIMLNYCGIETMLHMTCAHMTVKNMKENLQKAKELGIQNILALRGEILEESTDWKEKPEYLAYAADLVKLIREEFGDHFVICVAGYPMGHPESKSYQEDLRHLKEKVDAGADFIITQIFFKAEVFLNFVKDCRKLGISVPILPGIMPIQTYESLHHIVKLSQLNVPEEIINSVAAIKDNDEAIRKYGIDQAVDMCRSLLNSGLVTGLHFYTLNREVAVTEVLKQLGMWTEKVCHTLPWKQRANPNRCEEDVRSIFWRCRPNSYMYRTATWEEFPNGRWGDSRSASFNDIKTNYLFHLNSQSSTEELLNMWGKELHNDEDVFSVFVCYLTGEPNKNEIKVTYIPWNDDEIIEETSLITEKLASVNRRGVLTINSQPQVNGVPSTDPIFGWGVPHGYIYQKAYLEFFTSNVKVLALKKVLLKYPLVNYHIINHSGATDYTNCDEFQPVAVTWGVFPGKEIVQSTVVDPDAFKIWKDEAFALWLETWAKIYPENSESRTVLQNIHDSYYLVNLVDNEYMKETVLWDILEEMLALANEEDQK